jgi:hypothetical protein
MRPHLRSLDAAQMAEDRERVDVLGLGENAAFARNTPNPRNSAAMSIAGSLCVNIATNCIGSCVLFGSYTISGV